MATVSVQRKLEYPVRKSTRSQRKLQLDPVQDENVLTKLSMKPVSPRKRTRKTVKNVENDENICVKPVDASPSKRKKEHFSVKLLQETPIRSKRSNQETPLKSTRLNRETPLKEIKPNKETPLKEVKSNRETPWKENQSNHQSHLKSMSNLKKSCKSLDLDQEILLAQQETQKTPKSKSSPSAVLKLHRQDGTPYQKAKRLLHTAKPDRLVCRERETQHITEFLEKRIAKGEPGSLYISGAPGTGKTAVLTTVIESVEKEHHCKTVYLNCMTLKDSQAIFSRLVSDLTGKHTICRTAKEAMTFLEKYFTSKGGSIILVLDEIDQLDSKKQSILYTMFEWPALPNSRLVLIGIANALDLTDRILPRLQARPKCKPELLNFTPYTRDQIVKVLQDRLMKLEIDGSAVMEASAVQFCARKVSAVAGDMRKALDVCRRAVEMVEKNVKSQSVLKPLSVKCSSPVNSPPPVPQKIGIKHIASVVSEVYDSNLSSSQQQQQTIPLQQKLVVCTMLLLSKQGKFKEVTLGKLHETYNKICKKRQVTGIDQSEFSSLCSLIESRGILGIKKGKEVRLSKVSLKYDELELEHAMQDKLLMSSILLEGIPN